MLRKPPESDVRLTLCIYYVTRRLTVTTASLTSGEIITAVPRQLLIAC